MSVKIGDTVRLLSIPNSLLEELPQDEAENLRSMIGEIFVVEDIDVFGGIGRCQQRCRFFHAVFLPLFKPDLLGFKVTFSIRCQFLLF